MEAGGRNIEVNYQTRRRRLVKGSTVTGEKEAAEVFSTKLTTAAKSEPPTRSHLTDPVAHFLIHQHVFRIQCSIPLTLKSASKDPFK